MAAAHGQMVSERDRLIVRPKTLAEAEATMEIDWEDTGATLRTVVSIHKCPFGFRSRLGYHATFYLTKPGGEEKNVGYIIAWRISKPTGVNPNVDPKYCLDEWYRRSSRGYNRDSWPLAACVWAFYGPGSLDPANYDQVVDQEKRDELGDGGNEVICIQTIYIKFREDPKDIESAYGGQQLAPLFLELYYRLLGGRILPAWFSLSGAVTYLLIPSLHRESPVDEVWLNLQQHNGWSDQELPQRVRDILDQAFKQPRFGFSTYVDKVRVFENTIVSVLGRVVKPEDSISEAGDRLLLPALT